MVAFTSFQFEEVENWLERCSETARINKLVIYQEASRRETKILLRNKTRILARLDKPISPEEQSQLLQEYIKEAIDSLGKEGLI